MEEEERAQYDDFGEEPSQDQDRPQVLITSGQAPTENAGVGEAPEEPNHLTPEPETHPLLSRPAQRTSLPVAHDPAAAPIHHLYRQYQQIEIEKEELDEDLAPAIQGTPLPEVEERNPAAE